MEQDKPRLRYPASIAFFTMATMFIAQWFAQQHMMETHAPGAVFLWMASGFVAVWLGLGAARKSWPQHSPTLAALFTTLTLGVMMLLSYRSFGGWGIPLMSYGPPLLAALLALRSARKEGARPQTPSM